MIIFWLFITTVWLFWMWRKLREVDALLDEVRDLRLSAEHLHRMANRFYFETIDEQTVRMPLIFHPEKTFGKN